MSFPEAFLLTLLIETSLLFILLRGRHGRATIIRNALAANLITHPLVWFAFPALGLAYPIQVASSELFAFIAEALIYLRAFKGMVVREALLLSLVCNSISFFLGIILL